MMRTVSFIIMWAMVLIACEALMGHPLDFISYLVGVMVSLTARWWEAAE